MLGDATPAGTVTETSKAIPPFYKIAAQDDGNKIRSVNSMGMGTGTYFADFKINALVRSNGV